MIASNEHLFILACAISQRNCEHRIRNVLIYLNQLLTNTLQLIHLINQDVSRGHAGYRLNRYIIIKIVPYILCKNTVLNTSLSASYTT